MKVSVMWMTRKRSHELIYSVSSFIHNADDNTNVEYIFVTDPDDDDTTTALEKIVPMAHAHFAELIHITADRRYGYGELEQYQNLAATKFTGDCILSFADDNICTEKGWDTEIRKGLEERKGSPAMIAITPTNEIWKGSSTIVGINREWYDKTKRFSGNRATDAYLCDLTKVAKIEPIRPNVKTLHLQRGKDNIGTISHNGVEHTIWGLPGEDDFGGFNAKKPVPPKYYHRDDEFRNDVTNFKVGIERFEQDIRRLKNDE
jgi:hypothetical protein|tara:strand:+ start:3878 stop:4657 length:780 start_codon:yes stop_codon:yes gene_type:complete